MTDQGGGEWQVIEGGREHRVGEGGHDGGPLLTSADADADARGLYLVAPLACEPNHVAEALRRRKRCSRLCRRPWQGRGCHEEENEPKTRDTVHDVTARDALAAGPARNAGPTENGNGYRPTPASCLCMAAAPAASVADSPDSVARRSQCAAAPAAHPGLLGNPR